MQTSVSERPMRFDLVAIPTILLMGFLAAIVEAAKSPDPRMVIQAWTFAACMAATGIWYLIYYGDGIPADERDAYANNVVKAGVVASMFWGIAGMLVGLIIALQLSFPNIFYFPDLPWTNFGRMRPLHTSAVIFAFGGNVLIATSFYVVQRTCRARLFGGSLPWFVFWGLQHVHRAGGHGLSARCHAKSRICRAGMVCRHLAHHRVGLLPADVHGRDLEAQGTAHLCRELVLSRFHRDDCDVAYRQQSRDSGVVP
jgi:hypothetical protein